MSRRKPTFAIALGDPLGIGPEIVAKALSDKKITHLAHWIPLGEPLSRKVSDREAGILSIKILEQAADLVIKGEADGIVTAPVSKFHLSLAGFRFPGQTEYFANKFGAKKTAMMLASPVLRVVLVTIHLPLRKIFRVLTPDLISEKIWLTHKSLQKDFGIAKPLIAVCGLNPHAGEMGLFGGEEKKIILPALRLARGKKIKVSGPHSPDTVFHWACQGKFDAVVCHYHDQGLIPLKTTAFNEGVNITIGLGPIRTSPDHGCAFDIAGKGVADPSSMKAAMKMAVAIWNNRLNHGNKYD